LTRRRDMRTIMIKAIHLRRLDRCPENCGYNLWLVV